METANLEFQYSFHHLLAETLGERLRALSQEVILAENIKKYSKSVQIYFYVSVF